MDKIKGFENFAFISNEKTNVKNFIATWSNRLQPDMACLSVTASMTEAEQIQHDADDLNLPLDTVQTIHKMFRPKESCSSKKSSDKSSIEPSLISLIDDPANFESVKHIREHCQKLATNAAYRSQNCVKFRHQYIELPCGQQHPSSGNTTESSPALACLTVQIYRQLLPTSRPKVSLEREYQVLSCQPLTVLRDVFTCVTDVITTDDHSTNPLQEFEYDPSGKKAGMFLIDDVLYNDTRNEIISLHPLTEWMGKRFAMKFEEKIMNDIKFEDLTIRLGAPYLYVHAANCEHLFSFTDIRLFRPTRPAKTRGDGWRISQFPICTRSGDTSRLKCQMCSQHLAKWLVIDNQRLHTPRCYFCHNCFIAFNYDRDMNKIGNFKAYPLRMGCRDTVALSTSFAAN